MKYFDFKKAFLGLIGMLIIFIFAGVGVIILFEPQALLVDYYYIKFALFLSGLSFILAGTLPKVLNILAGEKI